MIGCCSFFFWIWYNCTIKHSTKATLLLFMILALNYPVGLHDLCLDSSAASYFKPSHESPGAADLGQTWFSCSLYSFHSEQAEQKSSPLEHLCWRTPEYSVFRGGADRTVTWPVPKKMADHCLHARKYLVSLDLFRSTPKCPVLLVYVAVLAYAEYSKKS